jgi:hypothetical protein
VENEIRARRNRLIPGTRAIVATLLLGVASALPAGAGPDPLRKAWNAKLVKIEQKLRDGKYSAASRSSSRLAGEVTRFAIGGRDTGRYLAWICTYRALAEHGLGNDHEALWYWHAARALYPGIDDADFGGLDHQVTELKRITEENAIRRAVHFEDEGVVAPKLLHQPSPIYPTGMVDAETQGYCPVQVVIDLDGRLKEPQVLGPERVPSLVYATLEAMAKWRAEPGLLHGTPFPVRTIYIYHYTLEP